MKKHYLYVFSTAVVFGILVFTLFFFLREPDEPKPGSEAWCKKYGPFISDSLGLDFPFLSSSGVFDVSHDHPLSDEERLCAIKEFQEILQNSHKATIEFFDPELVGNGEQKLIFTDSIINNREFADALCKQANQIGKTYISSPVLYLTRPNMVVTFHPSAIKINYYISQRINGFHVSKLYVAQGKNGMNWEGDFGDDFIEAILRARFQNGKLVQDVLE